MYQFKKDVYKDNRGKWSRVLEVNCHFCHNHLFFYQKDGPGPLKRVYIDRIIDIKPKKNQLFNCPHCNEILGVYKPFKKENNRPAFNWLIGAVDYKITRFKLVESSD